MSSELKYCIVRIMSGGARGTGFFYNKNYIVTCAHNINNPSSIEAKICSKDFAFTLSIEVELANAIPREMGDVALLKVQGRLPDYISFIDLASSKHSTNDPFVSFGFSSHGASHGILDSGQIADTNSVNDFGIPQILLQDAKVLTTGFSGAPIYNQRLGKIVGMVTAIANPDKYSRGEEMAFGIPGEFIIRECRKVLVKKEPQKVKSKAKELIPIMELNEDSFVGRSEVIDDIYNQLSEHHLLWLYGIGGIGKTSTALAFIKKYRENYDHLAWVTVSENLEDDIISQLSFLVEDFEYKEDNSVENNLQNLFNSLNANYPGRNLLIIDNANKLPGFEQGATIQFLKKINWSVLITSRAYPEGYNLKCIGLDKLGLSDSRELFYQYHRGNRDDETLDKLLKKIDSHTLLIELLAKAGKRLSIGEIFELIQNDSIQNKRLQAKIRKQGEEYRLHSYVVNNVFDFKDNEFKAEEQKYLRYFSILPPTNVVYEDLMELFQVDAEDDITFWEVLEDLSFKGWLINSHDQEKGSPAFKMHPIIQDVMASRLSPDADNCKPLIKGVTRKLQTYADENGLEKATYIPFGEAVLRAFPDRTADICLLMLELAKRYNYINKYEPGERLLHEVKKMVDANLIDHKLLRKRAYRDLAYFRWSQSSYKEAKELMEVATQIDIAEPKDAYLEWQMESTTGMIERQFSNYDESIQAYEKALAIIGETKGLPQVRLEMSKAIVLNNLAFVYRDLKNLPKAIELMEKAIELRKRNGGKDFIKLAINYNNISIYYAQVGRLEDAIDANMEAIRIRKLYFKDPDHYKWSFLHKQRSWILYQQEKFQEAIKEIERAIEIRILTRGEIIPANREFYEYYTRYLIAINEVEKAKVNLRKVIQCYNMRGIEKQTIEDRINELKSLVDAASKNQ